MSVERLLDGGHVRWLDSLAGSGTTAEVGAKDDRGLVLVDDNPEANAAMRERLGCHLRERGGYLRRAGTASRR